MKTALFWAITQHVVAVLTEVTGQHIGPIFKGQKFTKLLVFLTLVPKLRQGIATTRDVTVQKSAVLRVMYIH